MIASRDQVLRYARAVLGAFAIAVCAGGARGGPPTEQAASRPDGLSEALRLTAQEQAVLGAVVDGTETWRDTGFYVLLARAGELAQLVSKEEVDLDRPAYRSLRSDPDRYRGRAVRLRLRAYRVLEMKPETGLGFSRAWARGRSAWRMFCTTAGVSGADEPVVLYSACEPGALGIASSRDDHGEARYADGPLVDADCLFYKTYRDREADGGAQREYPLLLAWRIAPVLTDGPTRWGRLARFAGVLVLIGAAYVSLKRRIRASAPARRALAGGKRRDEGAVAPEDESPGDVDPKLRKAAEEYLQERQEGDGADGTG